MVAHSTYNRVRLKKRLIKLGVLADRCSQCGQRPFWNEKPLVMVLDHINGVADDNRIENLRLLCPNCNSQTDTFSGRKLRIKYFCQCGKEKLKNSLRCQGCNNQNRHTTPHPGKEVLMKQVNEMKYGVSDNAVRKWING